MLAVAVLAMTVEAVAGDEIDIDLWHLELAEALGPEPGDAAERRPAFGLYPNLGVAGGSPNWLSLQGHGYVSFTDGHSFSLYAGYGVERGGNADARIITLGWGGVRPLEGSVRQLGFHGKYLRYRRWDGRDHGIHHGLAFGTESGLGALAVSVEVGAARSARNHWLITVQFCLKLAAPIRVPLGKADHPPAL
jgi:hypothetical protein